MSQSWTRVTLSGEGRNVEMVLPSDQSVGRLMPEVLQEFTPNSAIDPTIWTLTVQGRGTLPWGSSLQDAGVRDGAELRLTPRIDSHPSPVVYDLLDLGASTGPAPIVWAHGPGRTIGATAVASLLGFSAVNLLTLPLDTPRASLLTLSLAIGCLLLAGVLDNRRRGLALPLLGLGTTFLVESVFIGDGRGGVPLWLLAPGAALVALSWFAGNRQWRHLAVSAAAMATLALVWTVGLAAMGPTIHQAAVAAVVTMVLLGALPRVAVNASGLASLDDQALRGDPVERPQALSAIDAAHQGLVAAVAACALSSWRAVAGLVPSGGTTGWSLSLALVVVLLTALRSRTLPLVVERTVLQLGAVLGAVALATRLVLVAPGLLWAVGGGLLALAGIAVAGLALQMPEHGWARLRLAAGRLESTCAVLLVPVAVGLFGVYGELSQVFQR